MKKANTNGIIFDENENINGFLFHSNFDTSQIYELGNLIKNIKKRNTKIYKNDYIYQGKKIPIILISYNEKRLNDTYFDKYRKKILNFQLKSWLNKSLDIEALIKNDLFIQKYKIGKNEYFIEPNKMFYCSIFNDTLLFMANPFLDIFETNELIQNKKYKNENCMLFNDNEETKNNYTLNIKKRQSLMLSFFKNMFSDFELKANENGFVVGEIEYLLGPSCSVLVGTKEDSINCLDKKIYPYYFQDGLFKRYSKEKINELYLNKLEYNKKQIIIAERISFLEKILKEKGKKWTIIDKKNIHFDEYNKYKVYMNTQSFDNANKGWYYEDDFIDWINMEGKIPDESFKIEYFSKILEQVSKNKMNSYKFEKVKKQENSYVGVFIFSQNWEEVGTYQIKHFEDELSLDMILSLINENDNKILKKYTKDDFEKDFKKSKNIFYKFLKRKKTL